MEPPHMAWEFMKKLANSPWAPVIRLIEGPNDMASHHASDLREDLEDCAAVVEEETDLPVQKTSSRDELSSEDSDSAPRYCPSITDSDDSDVVRDIEQYKQSVREPSAKTQKTSSATKSEPKPCPESKKSPPSHLELVGENDSSDKTVILSEKNWPTKLINYDGQMVKLKTLKIVLIDLFRIYGAAHSVKPSKESAKKTECSVSSNSSKIIISEDGESDVDVVGVNTDTPVKRSSDVDASKTSKFDNLKRRNNLSWGLDSIQELEKRRKMGKTVRNKVDEDVIHVRNKVDEDVIQIDDDQEVELVTPCSIEVPGRLKPSKVITSKPQPKPPSSCSLPNNPFGLNAWRLALVVQELQRLQELAEKLQKDRWKLDVQKSIAYKFKYGLSEVARLVTKKSLNTIVAEQEKLAQDELRKSERRALNEEITVYRAVPERRSFPKGTPPSCKLVPKLDRSNSSSNLKTSITSKTINLKQPVIDVHVPTLVQGVAAGFLNVFDRLERLESKCNQMEKMSKSEDISKSIDFGRPD